MMNSSIYDEKPSVFQRYIALTNQKQILVDKVCEKIISNNKSNKLSFIDIGCADGMVTTKIIDRLKDTYQLDINAIEKSTPLIDEFKSKTNYDINFINEDIESIKILPKADFILMSHVISYIDNQEQFLKKVIDSLNEKGIGLIIISNDSSDDVKVLSRKETNNKVLDNINQILINNQIKFDIEVVESTIDVSGIEEMNDDGKTIIEFFKHKSFNEISTDDITDIRNKILEIANIDKKLIKKENYIWLYK